MTNQVIYIGPDSIEIYSQKAVSKALAGKADGWNSKICLSMTFGWFSYPFVL